MILSMGLLAGLLAFDLVSKTLIAAFFNGQVGAGLTLVDGIFNLVYAENPGASFGLFQNAQWLLIALPVVVCVAGIAVLVVKPNLPKFLQFAIVFVLAGAIGNLVDRILLGYVRDFIDYAFLNSWFGIQFAIGNFADIFILVGVVMLLFYILALYEDKHFEGVRWTQKKTKKHSR